MVVPEQVVVHPLVLLSVVDHYQRTSPGPGKRVVGVLLGQWIGKTLTVSNSYAVPFEENDSDQSVWFLDHNYHENMSELYKKVNAKERPVGWYHSGPKLRSPDLKINELFRKYSPNPVLVIIDPVSNEPGTLPINSYMAVEEIGQDGRTVSRTFSHINSIIEAEEAEEIGIEHLLRNVKDQFGYYHGALSSQINTKLSSLSALQRQLSEIESYLECVAAERLPLNNTIIQSLQDLLNLLPDVHSLQATESLTAPTNDHMTMILVGNLIRAIISLHELVDNKLTTETLTNSIGSCALTVGSKDKPLKDHPTNMES